MQGGEKQLFSDFRPDDDVTIVRDSAFTVFYNITNYDSGEYGTPTLNFFQGSSPIAIPAGSTIILRDRIAGSYWYYKAQNAVASVAVTEFKNMLSDVAYTLPVYEEDKDNICDLKLQFVVDFSQAQIQLVGGSFSCSMTVPVKQGSKAAEITSSALNVRLFGTSTTLTLEDGSGLSRTLKLNTAVPAAASRYDNRDLALILIDSSKALPPDAEIMVSYKGKNVTRGSDADGKFVFELGDYINTVDEPITITLSSAMFPIEQTTEYILDAQLWLSNSDAEAAPLAGTVLGEVENVRFEGSRVRTGIRVNYAGETAEKRVFKAGDSVTVLVDTYPVIDEYSNYSMSLEVHQKHQNGVYEDTLMKYSAVGDTYSFRLGSEITPGSYCVVAKLHDGSTYAVNEARYYFIVE